jgi:hypothetical protein
LFSKYSQHAFKSMNFLMDGMTMSLINMFVTFNVFYLILSFSFSNMSLSIGFFMFFLLKI